MGATYSCTSYGAVLLVTVANGELGAAQELLKKHPRASLYHNFKDKSSPLLQAAARGHFELLQLVLETAVMVDGPERAKRDCIDHTNQKKQTALMVACKHGHPDCVEYLVTNGADPLLWDERRHNSCLHFAALYGHSECIHKLLGSRAGLSPPDSRAPFAQLLCRDEDDTIYVKFIDRHNGWGLTALHIAVFQGSVSTVRALLRHGANLESTIIPSKVENSPIRCAVGSNALHIAALIGNIVMAKLILEAQERYPGLELRGKTDAAGLRAQEYAQRARNPVLVHLLDERLPVPLLRQIWMNYSLEQSLPPRHQTLASLLQKLKLMFNLELIAIQRNMAILSQEDAAEVEAEATESPQTLAALALRGSKGGRTTDPATARQLWNRRYADIQLLLNSVTSLHNTLQILCRRDANTEEGDAASLRSPTHEAVLDFILSTLITPRSVSSILHAAKKLVVSSVTQEPVAGGNNAIELPPNDTDAQHGLALLTTALRAVETCLHAATCLAHPETDAAVAAAATNGTANITPGTTTAAAVEAASASVAAATAGARTATTAGSLASSFTAGVVSSAPSTLSMSGLDVGAATALGTVVAASTTQPPPPPPPPPPVSITTSTTGGVVSTTTTTTATTTGATMDAGSVTQAPPPVSTTASEHWASGGAGASATAASTTHTPGPSPLWPGVPGAATPLDNLSNVLGLGGLPASSNLIFGGAAPTDIYSSHWSSHLHALISQLQWDIGVQRHRRRRQHAVARATAAAVASAEATTTATVGAADGAVAVTAVEPGASVAEAVVVSEGPVPSASAIPPQSDITPEEEVTNSNNIFAAGGLQGEVEGRLPMRRAAPSTGAGGQSPGVVSKFTEDALTNFTEDNPSEGEGTSVWSDEEHSVCSICMDMPVAVLVAGCHHGLCVQCAFQLTIKGRELPSCPFCRQKIVCFEPKPTEESGGGCGVDGVARIPANKA